LIKSKKFGWADDYFATSVSKSHIGKIRAYIKNQKQHHQKVTVKDEYEFFINSVKDFDGLKSV
jgi:hypothetical protein